MNAWRRWVLQASFIAALTSLFVVIPEVNAFMDGSGYWAIGSALSVLEASTGASLRKLADRVLGTFVGGMLAWSLFTLITTNGKHTADLYARILLIALCYVWPFPWGCTRKLWPTHPVLSTLASYTGYLIIASAYSKGGAFRSAAFRVLNISFGVAVTALVCHTVFPYRARHGVKEGLSETLSLAAKMLDPVLELAAGMQPSSASSVVGPAKATFVAMTARKLRLQSTLEDCRAKRARLREQQQLFAAAAAAGSTDVAVAVASVTAIPGSEAAPPELTTTGGDSASGGVVQHLARRATQRFSRQITSIGSKLGHKKQQQPADGTTPEGGGAARRESSSGASIATVSLQQQQQQHASLMTAASARTPTDGAAAATAGPRVLEDDQVLRTLSFRRSGGETGVPAAATASAAAGPAAGGGALPPRSSLVVRALSPLTTDVSYVSVGSQGTAYFLEADKALEKQRNLAMQQLATAMCALLEEDDKQREVVWEETMRRFEACQKLLAGQQDLMTAAKSELSLRDKAGILFPFKKYKAASMQMEALFNHISALFFALNTQVVQTADAQRNSLLDFREDVISSALTSPLRGGGAAPGALASPDQLQRFLAGVFAAYRHTESFAAILSQIVHHFKDALEAAAESVRLSQQSTAATAAVDKAAACIDVLTLLINQRRRLWADIFTRGIQRDIKTTTPNGAASSSQQHGSSLTQRTAASIESVGASRPLTFQRAERGNIAEWEILMGLDPATFRSMTFAEHQEYWRTYWNVRDKLSVVVSSLMVLRDQLYILCDTIAGIVSYRVTGTEVNESQRRAFTPQTVRTAMTTSTILPC